MVWTYVTSLLAPSRSGYSAGGDDGALDGRRAPGQAPSTSASAPTRVRHNREASEILRRLGTPCMIHQPSYSMLNRWVERDLLHVLRRGRWLHRLLSAGPGASQQQVPDGVLAIAGAASSVSFSEQLLTEENLERVRALGQIASALRQSLAQMAIAWVLRDPRITSALVGVSSVKQLETTWPLCSGADFTPDELAEIDRTAPGGRHQPLAESSRA